MLARFVFCRSVKGTNQFAPYKQTCRDLMDLMSSLKDFGLEKELSLPQVVVVGSQSSGKSSVLEAISKINLPRGMGTIFETFCVLNLGTQTTYTLAIVA